MLLQNNIDLIAKIIIIIIVIIISVMIGVWVYKSGTVKTFFEKARKNNVPNLLKIGSSKSETIAIAAFCSVLHEKGYNWEDLIVSYRPDFLKNPKTNRNMEIDAYHPESKIGIEYNGIQHYEFPNHCHKTKEEFDNYLERDKLKTYLCKLNDVKLIDIPYYIDTCIMKNDKYISCKFTNEERFEKIKKYILDAL